MHNSPMRLNIKNVSFYYPIFQYEWERIYEESIQLKEQMNNITSENTRLKTRSTLLEKDLQKAHKIIEEMESVGVYRQIKNNREVLVFV